MTPVSTEPSASARGWWTRRFRLLLATRLVSQCGDGVMQAGIAWLVLLSPDAQRTPGAFAGVLALVLLPFSVVGPFAGVALDRWPRRHILVYGQLLRTVVVLAVAVVAAVASGAGVAAYSLVLVALGINRLLLAALSAAVPHTVPAANLVDANAVAPTSGTMATGVGLAGGAALLALDASTPVVLAAASVVYVCAALLAARFAQPDLGPETGTRPPAVRDVFHDLADTARHLRGRRIAAGALTRLGAFRVVFGAWTLWVFELTAGRSDDRAAAVVAVLAAAGYGIAAIVTPFAARRWGLVTWLRWLLVGLSVLVLGSVAVGGVTAWGIEGFALGLGGQTLKIQTDTIVQRDVEESHLGRTFTFYDAMFNVCFVLGALALAVV